ncbi:MAG: hypothetical protein HY586_07990 [Candidatus Omnitrophica bacterium]|nr:hypothetical protein [Candidatus Omnitrophota bacterium]
MSYPFYSALINFATALGVSYLVFLKNRKSSVSRAFIVFSGSGGFWALNYALWQSSQVEAQALFFIRLAMTGVMVLIASFLEFGLRLIQKEKKYPLLRMVNLLAAFAFLFLSFSPLYIREVHAAGGFRFWPVPGLAFHFFMAYFAGMVFLVHGLLLGAWSTAPRMLRKQIFLVLTATFVGFAGGFTNFFLWYGIDIPPYGNISVSICILILTYAIVAEKLMDIEVIIKKTLVFTGLFLLAISSIAAVTVLIQKLAGEYVSPPAWVPITAGVFLGILVYEPVRAFLVAVTDRYLFQKKVDYKLLLKEASQRLAEIRTLKRLAVMIVGFLIRRSKICRAAIFVRQSSDSNFALIASRPRREAGCYLELEASACSEYFQQFRSPVEIEDVREHSERGKPGAREMLREMNQSRATLILPGFLRSSSAKSGKEKLKLKCILFLGPQKSDRPYTSEERDALYTLVQESVIAIENARLFDEALRRSWELAETNRDLLDANERLKETQASLVAAEKDATMVGMAKAIGHEINNPLVAVLGRSSMAEREYKLWEEMLDTAKGFLGKEKSGLMEHSLLKSRENLAKITQAARRIEIVVHTLTHILKDTQGQMEPLSLHVLVREAIEAAHFVESNGRGVSVEHDIDANLFVLGNLEQLIQVFVNLLKNAKEAMAGQKKARILIRGTMDPERAQTALLEVEDNGPGIPAPALPHIWKQGFSTKVKKGGGLGALGQGQGLFVSRHIIESVHRGTLQAENLLPPAQGARFSVRLPVVM